MTALTERRAKRTLAWSRALLPALFFCLLSLGAACPVGAVTPVNSIRSIRTVRTGGRLVTYDITLTSSAEFPMNDSVVTLSIGGREFINSSYGSDGTLNTLVFSLTRSEFQSLKNGAPVVVYYGEDNAAIPAAQWNFGTLDLGLLDRGTLITLPTGPVTTIGAPVTIIGAPVTLTAMTAAVRTMTAMTAKTMTQTAKIAERGLK